MTRTFIKCDSNSAPKTARSTGKRQRRDAGLDQSDGLLGNSWQALTGAGIQVP